MSPSHSVGKVRKVQPKSFEPSWPALIDMGEIYQYSMIALERATSAAV